ncbi:hypothetical protein [Streptomyces sp. NPDC050988]|uniref:hypothetical protein n=1 Tax=Streptomyces sp. NPDC050988 TaxID=3365637 RepID=UPI0037BBE72E
MRALLQRATGAPDGRRGWGSPLWGMLVLAAWLILAVALGPLAGKLGDVEDSSANAFLPGGSESAQVNTELETPCATSWPPRSRCSPGCLW